MSPSHFATRGEDAPNPPLRFSVPVSYSAESAALRRRSRSESSLCSSSTPSASCHRRQRSFCGIMPALQGQGSYRVVAVPLQRQGSNPLLSAMLQTCFVGVRAELSRATGGAQLYRNPICCGVAAEENQ